MRPPRPPKPRCARCERNPRIRKDGHLAKHNSTQARLCPGSGTRYTGTPYTDAYGRTRWRPPAGPPA